MADLSLGHHTGELGAVVFSCYSSKGTNPSHEGFTLMTLTSSYYLPMALTRNINTLEGRVSTFRFEGDTEIYSITMVKKILCIKTVNKVLLKHSYLNK